MCIAAGLLFLLRGLSEFLVVTIMQVISRQILVHEPACHSARLRMQPFV